jgi:hypothetical protein
MSTKTPASPASPVPRTTPPSKRGERHAPNAPGRVTLPVPARRNA